MAVVAVEAREGSNMTWKSSCWAGEEGGLRSGVCGKTEGKREGDNPERSIEWSRLCWADDKGL